MEFTPMLINFIYMILGGIVTIAFMWIGYKIFDKLTHFNTDDELLRAIWQSGLLFLVFFSVLLSPWVWFSAWVLIEM